MIKTRTFTAVNGLDYVQHAELAFATIYIVAREGVEHEPYTAGGPVYRTYIHTVSNGKINFPAIFDGGTGNEKVFVLYKPTGGAVPVDPPGVCVAGTIVPITLADAADGQLYLQTITLTGTAPFSLSGITKPAWLTITNSGNTITLTGTPGPGDVTLSTLIEFTVSNCSGGSTVLFSQEIQVFAAVANFFIQNTANFSVQIIDVFGSFYTVNPGFSFPVNFSQTLEGIQSGTAAAITLDINGIVFPQVITLYKNAVPLESKVVTVNGIESFAAVTFTSSDEMVITIT